MVNLKDEKNSEQQETVVNAQTMDDVLEKVIETTKQEIHCVTLAKCSGIKSEYNDEDGYGIGFFQPIPKITNQSYYEIEAYFFSKDRVEENKLYCIVFSDYNFKNSLETEQQLETNDSEIHGMSNGIVLYLN